HVDLTTGNFNAQALADTISQIRGKLLGCVFDLPATDGGLVDPSLVNVSYTLNGAPIQLYRRSDPTNACTAQGCWDYTSDGRVELIGKACDDVKVAQGAKVDIAVGCQTIIQ